MCGIVGYIGKKEAYPILIKGLRRLEYRGYDSAGVALVNDNGDLSVFKSKGKVDNLCEFCSDKNVSGTIGIAHTRWATHGEPSSCNAHPHYSESHNLAIIHNGIIENYAEIKARLVEKGVHFVSDTDTEVLIQPSLDLSRQKDEVVGGLNTMVRRLLHELAQQGDMLQVNRHVLSNCRCKDSKHSDMRNGFFFGSFPYRKDYFLSASCTSRTLFP